MRKEMIHRWRHPSLACHLLGIVQGFAEIADGIVTISTLGFFGSGFEMRVARYRSLYHFRNSRSKK